MNEKVTFAAKVRLQEAVKAWEILKKIKGIIKDTSSDDVKYKLICALIES